MSFNKLDVKIFSKISKLQMPGLAVTRPVKSCVAGDSPPPTSNAVLSSSYEDDQTASWLIKFIKLSDKLSRFCSSVPKGLEDEERPPQIIGDLELQPHASRSIQHAGRNNVASFHSQQPRSFEERALGRSRSMEGALRGLSIPRRNLQAFFPIPERKCSPDCHVDQHRAVDYDETKLNEDSCPRRVPSLTTYCMKYKTRTISRTREFNNTRRNYLKYCLLHSLIPNQLTIQKRFYINYKSNDVSEKTPACETEDTTTSGDSDLAKCCGKPALAKKTWIECARPSHLQRGVKPRRPCVEESARDDTPQEDTTIQLTLCCSSDETHTTESESCVEEPCDIETNGEDEVDLHHAAARVLCRKNGICVKESLINRERRVCIEIIGSGNPIVNIYNQTKEDVCLNRDANASSRKLPDTNVKTTCEEPAVYDVCTPAATQEELRTFFMSMLEPVAHSDTVTDDDKPCCERGSMSTDRFCKDIINPYKSRSPIQSTSECTSQLAHHFSCPCYSPDNVATKSEHSEEEPRNCAKQTILLANRNRLFCKKKSQRRTHREPSRCTCFPEMQITTIENS